MKQLKSAKSKHSETHSAIKSSFIFSGEGEKIVHEERNK